MQKIEQLVRVLYTPGSDDHHAAQLEIQAAQKSASGWQLAQHLLGMSESNAQFLGAQTFFVQLNRRGETESNLPPAQIQREHVLFWLETSVNRNYATFVIRKLLQVVSKLFLSSSDWYEGISAAIRIVGSGSPLCFDLLNTLLEDSELSAIDLRLRLVPQISDVVIEILNESRLGTVEAVQTLERWASKFFDEFKYLLNDLLAIVVQSWSQPAEEELCEAALVCTTTLYSYEYRSWPPDTKKQLASCLEMLLLPINPAEFPSAIESDKFICAVQLVAEFCEQDFEQYIQLQSFLAQVAQNPVPIVDDRLASTCLWFWNQYAEEVIGSGLNVKSGFGSTASTVLEQVVSGYWPRVKLYEGLRSSDWEEFSSFRRDFGNFLELIYPIVGHELFTYLTAVVLESLPTLDWSNIELGLFCLNALSDIIGEDYQGARPELDSVQRIFQSELWSVLPECNNARVKQSAVNLIGSFVDFFTSTQGKPYLAVTLTYLFTCLGVQSLQNTASRSIQKLCDVCRSLLVHEIFNFLKVYEQIRKVLLEAPHVRTILGISYIIQVQPNLEIKASVLERLIDLILSNEQSSIDSDESEFTQLKCIAAVGKGIKDQHISEQSQFVAEFWAQNEISLRIRHKLQNIVSSVIPATNLVAVEAICDIVKDGINEDNGPFVLSESQIISFVNAKFKAGPLKVVSPVLDLARFFVASRLCAFRAQKGSFLQVESLKELTNIINEDIDEHALSAALDLLTQLTLAAHVVNLSLTALGAPSVLRHAYLAIESADRFVLKSCHGFWKEFLESETITDDQAFNLVRAVVHQISGGASRSELGPVVNILKLLMSRHTLIASHLLREMLVNTPANITIQHQSIKTRSEYLAQLLLLKGGRKTFDVTQKFWMKCRNIPEDYDPANDFLL